MSTRCNVILKEGFHELYFYRHSDGYPEGVKPSLDKFCELLGNGIRQNIEQAAGHLILIGMAEYDHMPIYEVSGGVVGNYRHTRGDLSTYQPCDNENGLNNWKVGSYEPATGIHGDIEHLYVVDIEKGQWYETSIPED